MTIQAVLLQMQTDRKSASIYPEAVLKKDLIDECIKQGYSIEYIENDLKTLTENKKLEIHRTINDKSIKLI